MTAPFQFARIVAGALLATMTLSAAAAEAEGPVYKDIERFDVLPSRPGVGPGFAYDEKTRRGPPRRVTGGPGYAGSEYGLGKPAFTGLGSRPDWGRSSE